MTKKGKTEKTKATSKKRPDKERFWERVDQGQPDECWPWSAGKTSQGYGAMHWKGSKCLAHRISYRIEYGPIPEGKVVMHSCDNPPCVNPNHLSIGTQGDNVRDAQKKGRNASGDDVKWWKGEGREHHKAELTDDQRLEVKRRYDNEDISQYQLSDEYGVSQSAISYIINHWEP